MNQVAYFKRVRPLFRPRRLQRKKAVVVGAGSGGSIVSRELGRLGAQLVLAERPGEQIEEHNIVRHVLGYDSLNRPKNTEMAGHIRNLNPSAKVTALDIDVAAEKEAFTNLLQTVVPDLVVECTDNDAAKYAVNEAAVRVGVPVIGAGVLDGGVGGEIYRVKPRTACYACIAAQFPRGQGARAKRKSIDYNNLAAVRSTPALNIDIGLIAQIHARVCLALLLGEEAEMLGVPNEANVWVFANQRIAGVFPRPLHCDFYEIAKLSDCLVCQQPSGASEAEAERILQQLEGIHDR